MPPSDQGYSEDEGAPASGGPCRPIPPSRATSPGTAALFMAAVASAFVVGGAALQKTWGAWGLAAAEGLFLLAPAVLLAFSGPFEPRVVLLWRTPSARAMAGGVLLVAGALPAAWLLVWIQTVVAPSQSAGLERLDRLVTPGSAGGLAGLLFVFAVVPAVCEEAVFRGVLLSSTARWRPREAILLNGLVFGLFHLLSGLPIRFLPTAWLGIVIAWAVRTTGTVAIGVLMHLLNNAIVVLAAVLPALGQDVPEPSRAYPVTWLVAAAAGLWSGARVLGRLPRD